MAAGQGTRMKSAVPQVLHTLGGRSLVGHAVAAARALDPEHLVVVVGTGREQVEAHLASIDPGVRTAVQEQQLGTGDAVRCGLAAVPDLDGPVIVTSGDVPLLEPQTLLDLVAAHDDEGNAITVLTARVPDPTADQRAIGEINAGIYVFDAATLRDGLQRITTDNAQGELYLTDVLAIARKDGRRVGAHVTADEMQTEGVNDRVQLATLRAELNRRTLDALMRSGVTIVDPRTTWVDRTVTIEPDVTLLPNTQLHGATTIATGATVGPDTTLTDVQIGPGAAVIRTHGSGAGIIFANYDGVNKWHTTVGRYSFVGSNSVLVAPREIADGAYVAAGTALTDDVAPGEIAVARGKQRNVAGWVARRRAGTKTAKAAEEAVAGTSGDTGVNGAGAEESR